MKKIWSYSTAVQVAAIKSAKYGTPYTVVVAKGGGHHVVPVPSAGPTASNFASAMGIGVVQVAA